MDNGGIRPMVKTAAAGNAGLWLFLAILLVAGFMLFKLLEGRRLETTQPATAFDSSFGGGRISSPEPLALPERLLIEELPPAELAPAPSISSFPPPPQVITRVVEIPVQQPVSPPVVAAPLPSGPEIVYDSTILPRAAASDIGQADGERVTATRFRNPSLTVPKGTVIPAVLESALDSTRPGFIRAIVSRDVRSFDGTRILIPRGSRIYGEYASDLNYGQNRALVNWDRLLRPDGVMINLGSPAADPLGRAGVRGRVNTHFFARFGAAILQSSLDIGVGLATRQVVGDGVIVALPGSNQNVGQGQSGAGGLGQMATQGMAPVGPTLTVRQGTAVSVFVAKDLDFSTVEE
jgi:type IV secretion system protein VirB10